ncbi:MAG: sigma-70 family RNA polymerase sigma factor [Gemmatimonadaceae bacterium]
MSDRARTPDLNVERLLRRLAPQVLGAVARRFRDFSASEDAVQEALIAAADQWPRDGVPDNPDGWLVQVARRRMVDHLRSEASRRNREMAATAETSVMALASVTDDENESGMDPQDTLSLLFMCCHPVLSPASAIALTLRAVGGLTTAQIAKSFLVPELTVGRRISRAKESIRLSGVRFSMPNAGERAERLGSVLHILYLIFNEGYTTSSGPELWRADLSNEAIRLVRQVHALLPGNGAVAGLLALMLLTDARRAARTGLAGELIPLDEQDRTLWDGQAIAEGLALASAALSMGALAEYQVQAAIAAVHDEAARAADTDWPQILALYEVLMRMTDSPVVALNHAIAVAMVYGASAGLALLAPLQNDERLRATHRIDAVRAHLLERDGQRAAAAELYRTAASKTSSVAERNYLLTKAARSTD